MDIGTNVRQKLNTYRSRWNGIQAQRRVVAGAVIAGLAVVVTAVAGISATSKTVMVEADGKVQTFTTWQRNIPEALEEAGIDLRPADVFHTETAQATAVTAHSPVHHRDKITVVRAQQVGVITPETKERRWVAAPTALQAAVKISQTNSGNAALALPHSDSGKQVVEDEAAATSAPTLRTVAATDTTATVVADGKESNVDVPAGAGLGEILEAAKIKLAPLDRVSISAESAQDLTIRVTRGSREVKTEELRTEKTVEEIKDDSMYTDETEVVEEGSDEVIVKRRFVVEEDGEVAYEQLLSEEKTSELKNRVIKVGTKTRPRPTHSGRGSRSGMSEAEIWAHIIQCESGGNPRAVNPAGYYGLYQFDLQTWRSVGGTGNPIDASPEEQTRRAKILQSQRGWSPWGCAP